MAHKQEIRKKSRPAMLAGILGAVSQELGLVRKIQEYAVLALWPDVVPASLRERTRAVGLKTQGMQQILQVVASDGPTASELTFHLDPLLARINSFAPQTQIVLSKIAVRIGGMSAG